MARLTVKHGAWVLICDGRKALILRNDGDPDLINLRRASVEEHDNPPSHEQGTDAPGKAHAPSGTRVGSIGETDWHTLEEQRFADTIAARLNEAVHKPGFKALIVVAPPKTLAELRAHYSKALQAVIAGEVPKDLTNHPIPAIEDLLRGYDV